MNVINFAHVSEEAGWGWFDHMMDGGHWNSDGGFVMMWVLFLLILVVVLWIAMTVTKNSESSDVSNERPVDIAEKRYAAGKITKKELTEIKKNLSNK